MNIIPKQLIALACIVLLCFVLFWFVLIRFVGFFAVSLDGTVIFNEFSWK